MKTNKNWPTDQYFGLEASVARSYINLIISDAYLVQSQLKISAKIPTKNTWVLNKNQTKEKLIKLIILVFHEQLSKYFYS